MLSVVIRCLFGGVPKNVQQKTVQKLTCASASASPKMLAKNASQIDGCRNSQMLDLRSPFSSDLKLNVT